MTDAELLDLAVMFRMPLPSVDGLNPDEAVLFAPRVELHGENRWSVRVRAAVLDADERLWNPNRDTPQFLARTQFSRDEAISLAFRYAVSEAHRLHARIQLQRNVS